MTNPASPVLNAPAHTPSPATRGTSVGQQRVVYSTTLIVRDQEVARLQFPVLDWEFELLISFDPKGADEPEMIGDVTPEGLHLTFKGFTKDFANASLGESQIGRHTSGQVATLRAFFSRVGDLNKVDLQVRLS